MVEYSLVIVTKNDDYDELKYLLCKKNGGPKEVKGKWNFVGGTVESELDGNGQHQHLNCALREFFEETGLSLNDINTIKFVDWDIGLDYAISVWHINLNAWCVGNSNTDRGEFLKWYTHSELLHMSVNTLAKGVGGWINRLNLE